jgi:hypothetical protein
MLWLKRSKTQATKSKKETTVQLDRNISMYDISLDTPEVQLRIVPRGSIANTQKSDDTYARNVTLLGDIVGAAVDPSEPIPQDYDLD